jgi:hypothetical protein
MKAERMKIQKSVTIGDQIGTLEFDETSDVRIALTNLKGTIKLADLETVLREARDLDRRVNPPAVVACTKKRR